MAVQNVIAGSVIDAMVITGLFAEYTMRCREYWRRERSGDKLMVICLQNLIWFKIDSWRQVSAYIEFAFTIHSCIR